LTAEHPFGNLSAVKWYRPKEMRNARGDCPRRNEKVTGMYDETEKCTKCGKVTDDLTCVDEVTSIESRGKPIA